jgi:hypothetical protein
MIVFLGLPLWLWVLFALGLVAAAIYYARDWLLQVRARKAIDNVISSVAYDELRNVLLPTGTGDQIHLHYLLLTQRGLLVIDLFDVQGVVFAGEKMTQWSVFGPKRHFTFTNPLPMLEERVMALRHLAGDAPVEGRIVFSMRSEFPKGKPDTVIRLDELQDSFPVVERSPAGVAAAFAPVWDRIKQASQPNPLAG